MAGERTGNARSPVALLAMGLTHGARVTVEGNGADCRAAVEAVAALIDPAQGQRVREAAAAVLASSRSLSTAKRWRRFWRRVPNTARAIPPAIQAIMIHTGAARDTSWK